MDIVILQKQDNALCQPESKIVLFLQVSASSLKHLNGIKRKKAAIVIVISASIPQKYRLKDVKWFANECIYSVFCVLTHILQVLKETIPIA